MKYFYWAVAITLALVMGVGAFTKFDRDKKTAALKQEKEQQTKKARFDKGAFVANESRISPTEIAKTIIYPGKDGDYYDELYDVTCLVYINESTVKQSMKCSGLMFNSQD